MARELEFTGNDRGSEARSDGATKHYFSVELAKGTVVEESNRLYVGTLSMDSSGAGYARPEIDDQVLVVFEHGGSQAHHSDFSWWPSVQPELL